MIWVPIQFKVLAPSFQKLDNTAPVVQKVDNAIHGINHYPLDSAIIIGFPNTYPWHRDLSVG